MSILTLDRITAGYGRRTVIENISFTVNEGDFLGIIGPNGAGKTTLFRLITRTLKPWQGAVTFEGRDIFAVPRRELARRVATVPQMFEIPFPFSVEEFVMMGRYPHLGKFAAPGARDREIAEESMASTDILHLRERGVNELSGGERQRAVLAQALAQSPKLLLLDEPTTHLDIGHQVHLMELISTLNVRHGLTIIVVLHDLNLAGEYCDKLALLHGGKIHTFGTPEQVLTYQHIEEVYKTVVVVKENPISGKPHIVTVSGRSIGKQQPA